jgi:hypothetical protein
MISLNFFAAGKKDLGNQQLFHADFYHNAKQRFRSRVMLSKNNSAPKLDAV